jgi:hypothetical protein
MLALQALMVGRYLSTAKPGTKRTELLGTVLAVVLLVRWVGCGALFALAQELQLNAMQLM